MAGRVDEKTAERVLLLATNEGRTVSDVVAELIREGLRVRRKLDGAVEVEVSNQKICKVSGDIPRIVEVCPKCGGEDIPEEAIFCPYCGGDLREMGVRRK